MVHQVPQHRGRHALVGKGLGVGVAEGVRGDRRAGEADRLTALVESASGDDRDRVHPRPQPVVDLTAADVGAAVTVLVRPRQQPELLPGSAREALGDPALLVTDRLHQAAVSDGQAPAHPAGLMVVIDEHRLGVLVDIEAVQVQAGHLADPAPGALEQPVGEHRHLAGTVPPAPPASVRGPSPTGDRRQQVEVAMSWATTSAGRQGLLLLGNGPVGVAPAGGEHQAEPGPEPISVASRTTSPAALAAEDAQCA